MHRNKIPQVFTLVQIFRRFTAVCEGEKEKATTDFARLSPSVGMRRLATSFSSFSLILLSFV